MNREDARILILDQNEKIVTVRFPNPKSSKTLEESAAHKLPLNCTTKILHVSECPTEHPLTWDWDSFNQELVVNQGKKDLFDAAAYQQSEMEIVEEQIYLKSMGDDEAVSVSLSVLQNYRNDLKNYAKNDIILTLTICLF